MTESDTTVHSATIFAETTELTIVELCDVCSVDLTLVDEMIDEGIIEPTGGRGENRRLRYNCVRRVSAVIRIQRDLGVNLAGAALALDLMDRIDRLRAQLRARRADI